MRILITGNLGYVGPGVAAQLRNIYPDATLIGFETGFEELYAPEQRLYAQHFGDLHNFPTELLEGVDILIQLVEADRASIIGLAAKAKNAGVRAFINPASAVNDLVEGLAIQADDTFQVRLLQFGTACGMSSQLCLDPILNNFVATAIYEGEIYVPGDANHCLSLIHVRDLARAIAWAAKPEPATNQPFLNISVGSDVWTYRRGELATAVAEVIPGTLVFCTDIPQEQCTSEFSFEPFKILAPKHQPRYTLKQTILELYAGLLERGIGRETAIRTPELV